MTLVDPRTRVCVSACVSFFPRKPYDDGSTHYTMQQQNVGVPASLTERVVAVQ